MRIKLEIVSLGALLALLWLQTFRFFQIQGIRESKIKSERKQTSHSKIVPESLKANYRTGTVLYNP